MADRYWRGTNSTWTDTANWSATRYGVTGASAPASTNDVYILDGIGDIDAYDASAVDLNSLTIGGNFVGRIKGLSIACSGAVRIACRNDIVLNPGTNNLDDVRVYSTGSATVRFGSGAGVITALQVGSGNVVIESGATVTTASVAGGTIVDTGGTVYTTLNLRGGTVYSQRGATTANVSDATLVALSASAWGTVSASNSLVQYNSSGTITTANAYPNSKWTDEALGTRAVGGVVINGAPTPFTVTNSVEWLNATLFDNAQANITYSNATTYVGKNGG